MNNIMQENEGCLSEGDIVPETQIIASSQKHIIAHDHDESSQGRLDFEDYMVQFEYGSRRRYKNSAPSLHVNFTPQTHNTLDGNLRAKREKRRRMKFMSSTSLGHQNSSLSNFNRRGEDDNFMGEARKTNLRSSILLKHQTPSQSNFSSGGEDDNLIGGSKLMRELLRIVKKCPTAELEGMYPIKREIGQMHNLKQP